MSLNKNIVKAIVETTIFLEFSSEDVVNPDAAIALMEEIAAILQNMEVSQKTELVKIFEEISVEYSDIEQQQFINELGGNLGLERES
jgi:16S rRNA C1402 (ribose-2'-O) methylase RsmI